MSYEEFRRRIDNARQILVGAVPSPAGQIDQITYALMYKFMNDIDDQSRALGGNATYFVGDYAKYNWHELMKPGLEAHDQLELYRQAIQGMSRNPNLPALFREIYQNAFLPFNTPHVLRLFLEEINKFNHGDSDDIGDAYEYLLSITGAQGDVGQFRTPRHIIKFIVEAVNPSKDDTVLDPAVGTAGFLIAAYNHVKAQHDGVDEQGKANDEKRLSADERDKLHHNYRGFDIDPTMVRTASVNLYLHGFTSPDIRNHDTLSSEDYWNDHYDIILANPPFMTPKGGIQPHKKFSITANRAEVLFVDYIASHLKPNGRAGVIVPEGIIFQSGKAYKELRKNLVENYLYAVVSLPAGVFQPYSGVKTSVLLMDKQLAKEHDEILFVKIENDGYSLGAQRRAVSGEQFTEALELIERFKTGEEVSSTLAHAIKRGAIATSDDYNLSGERYLVTDLIGHDEYPTISLAQLEADGDISFKRGASLSKKDIVNDGKYKCIHYGELYTRYNPVIKEVHSRTNLSSKTTSEIGDVLVPATTTAGPDGIAVACSLNESGVVLGGDINVVRTGNRTLLADYLSWAINYPLKSTLSTYATGVNIYHLSNNDLRKLDVIVPPIEIQREIVTELDGYQKIIDAAQEIVKTYKPTITINPEWEIVQLGNKEIFDIQSGGTPDSKEPSFWNGSINWATLADLPADNFVTTIITTKRKITHDGLAKSSAKLLPAGTVLVSSRATLGRVAIVQEEASTNQGFKNIIIKNHERALSKYVAIIATTLKPKIESLASGGTFSEISKTSFETLEIPLPPIEIQREIVAELEAEQQLVDANKKLIEIYQQKIKSKLAEIWGE